MRTASSLSDCDRHRRLADNQHTTPTAVVESIDDVMRAPTKRPHRQIETERRTRPKRERQLGHGWRPNLLFDFAVWNLLLARGGRLAAGLRTLRARRACCGLILVMLVLVARVRHARN